LATGELRWRILSSLVLISLSVVAVAWGGLPSVILVGFLGAWGMREWVRLFRPPHYEILSRVGMACLIAIILFGFLISAVLDFWLVLILAISYFLLARKLAPEQAGWVALGLPYLGYGCLALLSLRLWPDIGLKLTCFVLLAVWGTDIGAYCIGRWLRGPKLWPEVSPSKTWAGLWGGMAGAAFLTLGLALLWPMGDPVLAVMLACVTTLVAQAGDLFESYAKRRCGVKDSGRLIPGHGGVLDRIDGLVFAAIFLVLFQTFWGQNLNWW
jgi:phosphatidate cytidylyltransferase